MKVSVEISHNLRILGLSPGATASEVRSAFRRLARTCHPDIAGRQSARRFEQITGAYTFLKNLPQNELFQSETPKAGAPAPKAARWGLKWKNPLSWRRKRRESLEAERERERRAAEEAEERRRHARSDRVDTILARAERTAESLMSRLEREARGSDARDLALRLQSGRLRVRHLALSRLGAAANQNEILNAVLDLLQKWDIDERTARLVSLLPLSPENRKKLADALAGRASCMPDFLLACLLNLNDARKTDRALLGRYLQNANPDGVSFLLRHWPKGPFAASAPVLQNLLSREDENILVPLLSMMKRHSFPCPVWSLDRLSALSSHPSAAVRVWAKALLPENRK
jgi:curved DNA-binding protein CbpA